MNLLIKANESIRSALFAFKFYAVPPTAIVKGTINYLIVLFSLTLALKAQWLAKYQVLVLR